MLGLRQGSLHVKAGRVWVIARAGLSTKAQKYVVALC